MSDDELGAEITRIAVESGYEGQVTVATVDGLALKAFWTALRSGPKPWVPSELATALTLQRAAGVEVWFDDGED